ncbi:MAG TPA: hypothetical protein VK625_13275 [Flavitalea sp.]|nr:hypothetical protein [Flavitalea sp.]
MIFLNKQSWYLLITLIILTACAFGQTTDSSVVDTSTGSSTVMGSSETDEEFNLFLSAILFVGMSVMLGIAVITVALAGIVLLCLTALIAGGIISVSIGIGLYQKSVAVGIRTSFYLFCAGIGAIGGSGACWLLDKLFHFSMSGSYTLIVGFIFGSIEGFISAISLVWLIKTLFRKLALKS